MRRFWPLILFVLIFAGALIGLNSQSTIPKSPHAIPQRIITLAPSFTEIVFSLGLADNIVAVTDYCDFPAEALNLPKVGGIFNPNLEAIVALQPDLVILLASQQRTIKQLQQLNIPTLAVFNATLSDIQNAIHVIGQTTQHQDQAQKLLTRINQKTTSIKEKMNGLARPRVMITMGHSIGSQYMKQVFIAGQNDFYNDLITLAGGQNAYQDIQIDVPSLSIEGIMQINPEVIIDIFPEADDHDADLNNVLQQWQNLEHIDAVKNNRVHIIQEDYATIPGPRIFLLLDKFAQLIHPELNWEVDSP